MGDSTNKAVFLSYASQDAAAVARIAEALRTAGVEVWFDQNELVGGDAWDAKIRKQIAECALFVPVISAATQARLEGYFRLEWKLAVDRSHLMAHDKPFMLPVVIDATIDAAARVPPEFRAVQWTRLPGGETTSAFCARVKTLLGGEDAGRVSVPSLRAVSPASAGQSPSLRSRRVPAAAWFVAAVLAVVGAGGFFALRPGSNAGAGTSPPTAPKIVPIASEADQLLRQARDLIYDPDSGRSEFALAENFLKRATDLAPTSGAAWGASALLQHYFFSRAYATNRQRLVRSQSEAEKALRLDSRNTDALLALGLHRQILGDNDRAKDYLERARAADPQNFKAILAQSLLISDLPTRAKVLLEAASTVSRPAELYYYASINLAWSRQFVAARAANDRAIAAQPFWRVYVNAAVNEQLMTADPAKMTAWLDQVPELKRDEPRVAFMYYEAARLRRDGGAAVRVLSTLAVDYLEDNFFTGPKAFLLAQAHELAGQRTPANEQWQLAERTAREKLAAGADVIWWRALLAVILAGEQRGPEAKTLVEACAVDERIWKEDHMIELVAQAFTMLQEPSRAIAFLRAHRAPRLSGAVSAASFAADPRWDSLRSLPEYPRLIEELKQLENAATILSTDTATTVAPKPDAKSVAVLAFANLSDDKGNESFSDGISEELLNVLAKVPGLKVSARTSAFHFKGKDTPIPEIAQQLGVAHVVEGSVRKSGTHVRITAQLVKAADGFQVWSETFTREVKDIFAVQEEIAGLIAQALSLKLSARSAASTAAVKPEAFELYARARDAWRNRSAENLNRGEKLLNQALEIEPRFARAHAALADVWLVQGQNADTIVRFDQRDAAEQRRIVAKAQEALAIDPDSAEAHSALGGIHWLGWRRPEAEQALRRALAINPAYANARQLLGRVLIDEGRIDEGLEQMKAAAELDPLSSRIADNYGSSLRAAGRYREALRVLNRALQLQPDNLQADFFKAWVLVNLERPDEAVAIARAWPATDPFNRIGQAFILGQVGRRDEARAIAASPEVKPLYDNQAWFAIEEPQQALARLNPPAARSSLVSGLLFDGMFDPVRSAPLFVRYLEGLGLTAAHARAQAWRAAHPSERPEATP